MSCIKSYAELEFSCIKSFAEINSPCIKASRAQEPYRVCIPEITMYAHDVDTMTGVSCSPNTTTLVITKGGHQLVYTNFTKIQYISGFANYFDSISSYHGAFRQGFFYTQETGKKTLFDLAEGEVDLYKHKRVLLSYFPYDLVRSGTAYLSSNQYNITLYDEKLSEYLYMIFDVATGRYFIVDFAGPLIYMAELR